MKRLISIFAAAAVACQMFSFAVSAEDFAGHWAEDAIRSLIAESVIGGDQNGNINPDADITRAEFVKTVNRAFQLTEKAADNFADVSAEAWYYEEFLIAKQAGYLSGDSQGNADPDRNITRAEACVILNRVYTLPQKEAALSFTDAEQIPDWAEKAVSLLDGNGIVKGYTDGSFLPSNPIARAESFHILRQVKNLKGEAGKPTNTPPPVKPPVVSITQGGSSSGSGGGGGSSSTVNELAVPIPKLLADTYTYSWEKVKNASSYLVKLELEGSSKEISTTQTSIDLTKEIQAMAGASGEKTVTLRVCVKAVGSGRYQDSDYSGKTEFVFSSLLTVPNASLSESGYVYRWESVRNAASYLVKLDYSGESREISTTQTSMDLLKEIQSIADASGEKTLTLQVSVKAVAAEGYEDSDYSEKKEFVYTVVLNAPVAKLSESGYVYSWGKVENASSYLVKLELDAASKEISTAQTSVNLLDGIKELTASYLGAKAALQVSVKAVAAEGYEDSAYSEKTTFVYQIFNESTGELGLKVAYSENAAGEETYLAQFDGAADSLVVRSAAGTKQYDNPVSPFDLSDAIKDENGEIKEADYIIVVSAGEKSDTVVTDFAYAGGEGTEEAPFEIANVRHFNNIHKNLDAFFVQSKDFSGGDQLVPVSVQGGAPFTGSYTAESLKTIEVALNGGAYPSLFGQVNGAVIRNIGVSGTIESTVPYTAGIAGLAENSQITGCENSAAITVSGSGIASGSYTGGIVGKIDENSTLSDCVNSGALRVQAPFAGGIAGQADCLVENCENSGEIYNDNSVVSGGIDAAVGGVVGIQTTAKGIQNCRNSGTVENHYSSSIAGNLVQTGGIAGKASSDISGCVNEKEASVFSKVLSGTPTNRAAGIPVGGIVGYHNNHSVQSCKNYGSVKTEGYAFSFCGGIAGYEHNGSIDMSANFGSINSAGRAGGILGKTLAGSVNQSYNAGEITSASYSGGLVGHADSSTKCADSFNTGKLLSIYQGGLIGAAGKSVTVKNCYSVPATNSRHLKTGSILSKDGGSGTIETVENVYYVKVNEITDEDARATEVTRDQLSNAESPLAGFDDPAIWTFHTENGYTFPQLVNNPYEGE